MSLDLEQRPSNTNPAEAAGGVSLLPGELSERTARSRSHPKRKAALGHPSLRFGAAVLALTIAIAVSVTLKQTLDVTTYALIIGGAVIATWLAGLRVGIIGTIAAGILAQLLAVDPIGDVTADTGEAVAIGVAMTVAIGACFLVDAMKRAQVRAEALANDRQSLLDAISTSEGRLVVMADALPSLISFVDAECRYQFNNRAYETWFGHSRDEIRGRTMAEVLGEAAYASIKPYAAAALRGETVTYETLIPYRDGGERWVRATYAPDIAPSGRVRGFFALVIDITAPKRAEQALEYSEARARGILDATVDGIITMDERGRIESFNPAAERLFGYAEEEIRGRNVNVLMPPPYAEEHDAYLKNYQTSRAPRIIGVGREVVARRKDGTTFPIDLAVSEVRLADRVLYTGIVHDLSIRAAAQDATRRSELRYRSLAEATSSTIWATAPDGRVVEPQPSWEAFTGQSWREYRDHGWALAAHEDDRPEMLYRWQQALAKKSVYEATGRIWNKAHAAYRHCEMRGVPLLDDDGNVREWIGTTTDVEERYRALEQLRTDEERSRLAESAARFGTWEWDLQSTVTWSESMEAVYGFEPGTYPGTFEAFMDRVHPDDREMTQRLIMRALQDRRDLDFEHRAVLPDGAVRWLNGRGRLIVDPVTGAPVRMVGIGMDITERKAAMDGMLERERREHALAQISANMVSTLDPREILTQVARLSVPVLADICSIGLFDESDRTPRFETAGVEPLERDHVGRIHLRRWRADIDDPRTIGQAMLDGDAVFVPLFTSTWAEACAPDEEQRAAATAIGTQSLICMPLVARGQTIGMATFAMTRSHRRYSAQDVAMIREIASRASIAVDNAQLFAGLKDTAESLRRANAAKDEFLGLVSHELKTPITTILGNAEVLRRRFEDLDVTDRRESLDDIWQESQRLHRIIDNLLVLARLERGQEIETEPVGLRRVVERAAEAHRRTTPQRTVDVRWRGNGGIVMASADYVDQVLRNLIGNAEKYSPPHTTIEIEGEERDDELIVRVLDRGSGIDQSEIDAIFAPFYRSAKTADTAQGVGIGLAVCKRLIEAQGGRLWAHPRQGGGSEFAFALPALKDGVD